MGSQKAIYHIYNVQLYKTLHLEMGVHFQKALTETGPG